VVVLVKEPHLDLEKIDQAVQTEEVLVVVLMKGGLEDNLHEAGQVAL